MLKRTLSVVGLLCLCSMANAKDVFESMLPVKTPELTPGAVAKKTLQNSTSLTQPLFIVGDDPMSHRWLTAKQGYLRKINASGIVVNVTSKTGWNRMKQYGLTLYPVRGGDFAKAFELTHYPVLIENNTVKQ